VVAGGTSSISPVRLDGQAALRACIISYRTTVQDIDRLVSALPEARTARADLAAG